MHLAASGFVLPHHITLAYALVVLTPGDKALRNLHHQSVMTG